MPPLAQLSNRVLNVSNSSNPCLGFPAALKLMKRKYANGDPSAIFSALFVFSLVVEKGAGKISPPQKSAI